MEKKPRRFISTRFFSLQRGTSRHRDTAAQCVNHTHRRIFGTSSRSQAPSACTYRSITGNPECASDFAYADGSARLVAKPALFHSNRMERP
ncbi:hypothetical protein G3N58_02430 [Paraburkholderia sp. Ac-20342]|uniref:hypothetical protein n=1 Tax=Paraburkholderia sp. Ac-20342 TaxID=2703889 RepID=UPI00197DC25F|nr:hypothetical protein [Paraburkholderia sp. Ac-20342]MBN3845687.1 hypothetical protein [Paraburkholderia sp. Ac-20342]